jgi:hypothetical protein
LKECRWKKRLLNQENVMRKHQLRNYSFAKRSDDIKPSRFRNGDGSIKTEEFIQLDDIDNYAFQTRLIEAYGDWIKKYWENGWDVYFFTFVFKQIPGSPDKQIEQMFKEITWVYGRLLTRTFKKKARSPRWAPFLPRAVFFADRPGFRRRGHKYKLHHVVPNDGLHVHGLVAVVRPGSIRWLLDKHFRNRRDVYLIGNIQEIDVRPITHLPEHVTKYGAKALKSRAFSSDHVMILPKRIDELVDKTPRCQDPIKDVQAATNVSDECAMAISKDPKLLQSLLGKR